MEGTFTGSKVSREGPLLACTAVVDGFGPLHVYVSSTFQIAESLIRVAIVCDMPLRMDSSLRSLHIAFANTCRYTC